MSYCRFHNTVNDLQDCIEALEDLGYDIRDLSYDDLPEDEYGYGDKVLSREEYYKAKQLVNIMADYINSL